MSYTTTDQRIALFRKTRLLREANIETLLNLALQVNEITGRPGDVIIRQGDDTNDIFFIVEGEAFVKSGQHTIQTLKGNDVFGLYPIADFKERSATIEAVGDTLFLVLKAEDFFRSAGSDPSLIRGLAEEISENTRSLINLHQLIASQRDEIERQKNALIELNKTKDKLFSIMGHDLRSPVASIITLIDILRSDLDEMSEADVMSMLDDISQLSQIHLKLLENLLQWARLQTGALTYIPSKVLLSDVFEDAIQLCEHIFKAKSLQLTHQPDYQSVVFVDKNMIQTVVRNLLSNAAKFTPRGGKITLNSRRLNNDVVEVSIADTGIGMSEQQLGKLFKPDKLQSRYGTENEAGTGLGLLICHDFIVKNQGKIWVESREKEGSVFYFTLPIHQPSHQL